MTAVWLTAWVALGLLGARLFIPLMDREGMATGGRDEPIWRGFTVLVIVAFAPILAVMAVGVGACWLVGKVATR